MVPATPISKPAHLRDEFTEWLAALGTQLFFLPAPRKFRLLQMHDDRDVMVWLRRDQRRESPPAPFVRSARVKQNSV